jgi:hypothetical protein
VKKLFAVLLLSCIALLTGCWKVKSGEKSGVWFSVTGPHSGKFTSTAVAVNYFF